MRLGDVHDTDEFQDQPDLSLPTTMTRSLNRWPITPVQGPEGILLVSGISVFRQKNNVFEAVLQSMSKIKRKKIHKNDEVAEIYSN